ncbi:probable serine/threonine-protein kinase kinX isoform X2 [Latimeria chalumnae]|uniref:probable serine/threonine-protein kinase kinX isoform X2 n=1 Tax=Latimeria chalumnae TaxID=7897 RepID=UPI0003C19040|nr:PREDICTED: matrix-remodeling-associated protein 7 isoform X2 [Latimeria chalumnae]|eukprot:XP_005993266.1 PREDICTED: matrix-remodeling-associated protein 7 isoform X2 [Latimeria chalumnae]
MDVGVDFYAAVPLLFTALAVVLAFVFLKLRSSEAKKPSEGAKEESKKEETEDQVTAEKAGERVGEGKKDEEVKKEEKNEKGDAKEEEGREKAGKIPVEEIGAEEGKVQPDSATKKTTAVEKETQPQEEKLLNRATEEETKNEGPNTESEKSKKTDSEHEAEEAMLLEYQLSYLSHPEKLGHGQSEMKQTELEEEEQSAQTEEAGMKNNPVPFSYTFEKLDDIQWVKPMISEVLLEESAPTEEAPVKDDPVPFSYTLEKLEDSRPMKTMISELLVEESTPTEEATVVEHQASFHSSPENVGFCHLETILTQEGQEVERSIVTEEAAEDKDLSRVNEMMKMKEQIVVENNPTEEATLVEHQVSFPSPENIGFSQLETKLTEGGREAERNIVTEAAAEDNDLSTVHITPEKLRGTLNQMMKIKEQLVVVDDPTEEETVEDVSFNYAPGKLRGSQYETMLTKEELEEEQRAEE